MLETKTEQKSDTKWAKSETTSEAQTWSRTEIDCLPNAYSGKWLPSHITLLDEYGKDQKSYTVRAKAMTESLTQ